MNMNYSLLLGSTLFATFYCQTAGKLIIKPSDTDVRINHSTHLNCSTDTESTTIFWFHGENYVYTGVAILEPYTERFSVDRNVRNGTYSYNLVIHLVQPGDAGQYICSDDEVYEHKSSAQLIVLDDDPICRSNTELNEVIGQNDCNIEPDEVELECSVTYHGNIPPQMQWKKVGEGNSTPLEVSVVSSRNHFVSTLKLKGDIAVDRKSYVCETKRTTQGSSKCTSQVIQILYALGLNGFSAVNSTIDNEILCNANTSQSCSYKWKWLQDNDFTIESSTSVLKARKPGWHRCEAECYLRNRSCNLVVMRTLVYGKVESSLTWNITISVIVSVVVTIVMAVCLICIMLYFSQISRNKDNDLIKYSAVTDKLNHFAMKPMQKTPEIGDRLSQHATGFDIAINVRSDPETEKMREVRGASTDSEEADVEKHDQDNDRL